jgi:hypothetical protein
MMSACLVVATIAGCNRAPNIKLVPVTGHVTYNGQALTTGSVSFRPNAAKGNTSNYEPAGEIDAAGNYKLFLKPGMEGAPPGWYYVGVVSTAEPDPQNISAVPKSFIPRKYGMATESGLEIELVENPAPGAYDLSLGR